MTFVNIVAAGISCRRRGGGRQFVWPFQIALSSSGRLDVKVEPFKNATCAVVAEPTRCDKPRGLVLIATRDSIWSLDSTFTWGCRIAARITEFLKCCRENK